MCNVRRVDRECGEGGCDLRGGGTRIAWGDRGQEVGVVVPYPGCGVIAVMVAVIPTVIRIVIETVRAVIGAVIWPQASWEGYGGYADWGDRGDG